MKKLFYVPCYNNQQVAIYVTKRPPFYDFGLQETFPNIKTVLHAILFVAKHYTINDCYLYQNVNKQCIIVKINVFHMYLCFFFFLLNKPNLFKTA